MTDIFFMLLVAFLVAFVGWSLMQVLDVNHRCKGRLERNRQVYEFRKLILKMSCWKRGICTPYSFLPTYEEMLESDGDLMDHLDYAMKQAACHFAHVESEERIASVEQKVAALAPRKR